MDDAYLGEIRMFAGDYAPVGWALCDGQRLNKKDHGALFDLIGYTYDGDGKDFFAVPDLRGRIPVGSGTSLSSKTPFALGQLAGTETVSLTEGQLPVHGHRPVASSGAGTQAGPGGQVWSVSSAPAGVGFTQFSTGKPNTSMNPGAIAPTGGGQPHENLMPFAVINFILCLDPSLQ